MGLPAQSDEERLAECAALAELAERRLEWLGALRPEVRARWAAWAEGLREPVPDGPGGRDPVDTSLMRVTPRR